MLPWLLACAASAPVEQPTAPIPTLRGAPIAFADWFAPDTTMQAPGMALDGLSWWLLGSGAGVDIRWRHRSGAEPPEVTVVASP
ncbi:MAG: hypothetical protein ACI8S6_004227 [Myxococcota bacterium]